MSGGVVEAVVFDLDGVLVDSEELWDEVRRAVADEAGRPWPADATRAMQGMSTAEWSAYLTETVGVPGRPDEVATTVIDRMAARYGSRPPLLPGAGDAVRRLGSRWPLGLASSSPRRLIDAVLESAEFSSSFRATVSTEEVGAGKPSPAVYREAVRRLGVSAEHAVAVEDSSNGLRSAAAAGLGVIAVPNVAFPPDDNALALAGVVVRSLDEISAQLVLTAATTPAQRGFDGSQG
jgi:HAD superfamily hydrolase (TIGR01509 family)